ncbi:sulfite exporter TauE/SafE family protein [Natrialbaceae archaeon A-gly3]
MGVAVLLETCHDATLDPAAVEPLSVGVFFLIGLLGGAHCLGMCGPLVTTYADRLRASEESRRDVLTLRAVRQHALFNLGRAASYALLGGLFGLAGTLVFVTPRTVSAVVTDVHLVAGVLVGLVIIAIGVSYLTGRVGLGGSFTLPVLGPALAGLQARLLARVDDWVGGIRIAGLGGAHGLFPCPITYPAYLYAFILGSPVAGASALAALGLGTVPSLFLYATAFGSMSLETRMRLHRVLGAAFIVLGYIPLQHGLAMLGVPLPHPPIPYYQPLG